ncbi:MAG: glycine oxidase [Flavobacteriales bacterium]
MKKVDYIIVGLGLAGIAFCEQCIAAGKTFFVYDSGAPGASRVAAGLYNPVILKRYTLPWRAIEQFDLALPYYQALEAKLGTQIIHTLPVRKVFSSIEDQNNWFAASDHPGLDRFIEPHLVKNTHSEIAAPYDFGEVRETGRIDIKMLQSRYEAYLDTMHAFAKASFIHSDLVHEDEGVSYQGIHAKRIVFAEGFGVKQNPYFSALPLVGNKGEYLIIKAEKLKLKAALKSSFFIVPLGNDHYKVGATFNWTDKDVVPTEAAKAEVIEKFTALVDCPFEIIDQEVGIRPTTGDRRALVGVHPAYDAIALLNGLGTRGTMASPLLAKYLFERLELNTPLPDEINILRFPKKFKN